MGSIFGNSSDTETVDPVIKTEQIDRSKLVYFRVVRNFNRICRRLKAGREVDCTPLLRNVEQMVKRVRCNEKMLMSLAQAPLAYIEKNSEPIPHPEVVLYGINTLIYALEIATSLGFPSDKINYLGVASLLQNIGYLDETQSQNESPDIITRVKSIAADSSDLLDLCKIDGLHKKSLEAIIEIIQSKETVLDQTSLQNTLQQYAMVIHICNVFVRLTHDRKSRKALAPTDAMRIMRSEMQDFFHADVVKLFFNRLSMYPIGTFVRLSSSEIAKIVDINEKYLMRPVVLVVLNNDKQEKLPFQRINLRENPNLYIKSSIVNNVLTERYLDAF